MEIRDGQRNNETDIEKEETYKLLMTVLNHRSYKKPIFPDLRFLKTSSNIENSLIPNSVIREMLG